ncbi:DUF305 domain-containing protein [Streptomyces marincola]|uniref:DUF305 domain-containing protein n=1 Tax=Streptomyces marincola TaxID=2878388 RepID=UPI001CF0E74B|nr:DUF305 domain-containing protein [Streptomyces marincola]UCM86979.1 DUF305 domain-containing protein [Streptomyces marincola]
MTGRRALVTASGLTGLVAAVLIAVSALAPSSSSEAPGDDSADAGFARDMAVHHQQAVEMSLIVRDRTDDEEVRLLAYDILNTQANQRGMMLGWLEMWDLPKSTNEPMRWMAGHGHGTAADAGGGAMPGMASDEDLAALRSAEGRDAEIRYLELMTVHHQGGVEMAEAAVAQADTEEITRLAAGMVDAQESEIALMADLLDERGA